MSSAALLALGCNLDNPGFDPPPGQVMFPVALSLSQDADDAGSPSRLFVVNSNFDLAFNASSVQAIDLNALEQALRGDECRQRLSDTELIRDGGGVGDAGLADGEVVDDETEFDDASTLDPDASVGLDGGIPVDGSALDGAVTADAAVPEAGLPDAAFSEAGAGDAGAVDAGALDASAAADGSVADGGTFPLEPEWNAPSVYGTPLGVLCEDNQPDPCCYQREWLITSLSEREDMPLNVDEPLLANEVEIASYATGVALAPDGNRLYVPVRSDDRLIFLDIEQGDRGLVLSCGGEEGECTRGPNRNSPDRDPDAQFPPSPTAVVAGRLRQLGFESDDTFVVTGHERGEVSLFLEMGGRPVLQDVLPGASNRLRTNSLTLSQTDSSLGAGTIYATSNDMQNISRIGAREFGAGRPELYTTTPIQILGLSPAFVMRDVQVDPRDPTRIYALTGGNQQAVAFLALDSAFTAQAFTFDSVEVGNGPSRLRLATLGRDGAERVLLFASSYDAGNIFVIDVDSRQTVAVIRGFNGPYDMAIDAGRNLMYVADFRSSVVRVVDIAALTDRTQPPPRIIATLGALRFSGGPT